MSLKNLSTRSQSKASSPQVSTRSQSKASSPQISTQSQSMVSSPQISTPSQSKAPTLEIESDIVSLCTLKMDVEEYLEKTRSADYHESYPGVERLEYDFAAERCNLYATNLVESIAHLIKGCFGAGILGMHEAYMHGGLWTSLFSTVIIGLLISSSMLTLVKCAQTMYTRLRVFRLSYPDLAEVAVATGPLKVIRRYSKVFRYIVESFLFIEFTGTCCIFQIMIAHTLKEVSEGISPNMKERGLSVSIYVLIITGPLILLCIIRSIKYMAPFSLLADIFCAICVITTMYYSLSVAPSISERPGWKSVPEWIRFSGVCIYSMEAVGVTLPIENYMAQPRYFSFVLHCGMTIVVILVASVGFFGYWGWGESCRTPITVHMPLTTAPVIMQFLLAAALSVSFAVHFWIPFRVIWHYIGKRHRRKRDIWERIYRSFHVILITGFATVFPDLIKWMSFLGNFFLGFIVFIFPAVIETLVMWEVRHRSRFRRVKDSIYIVIGVFLCCGSIYAVV